ncbi:OmpA family protein [Pontibacter locisalis]|uniref:OmpA family protein n=2 Tax=Pontibacter locisalis TaxID=1719035 RepID=A0ABW5IJ70_9BACT
MSRFFSGVMLWISLFLLLAFTASAQGVRGNLRAANKYFEQENHREAIPYFEKVLAKDPDNVKALYRAGISYMAFDKEKSIDYLDRAQELNPKVDRELQYWLGRVYHINYLFEEAITYFQGYKKTLSKREVERLAHVDQLIQHAENAKAEVSNPKDVFVKNLGGTINTAYSEHSPVISSDYNYLLFTSRGEKATGGKEAVDGEFYEDIFETRRIAGDKWETTRVVPGALNSVGHDASIQLFDNDRKMLLYRANKDNNSDIMVSERQKDGSWGAPKSISDKVNTRDFESDAFITPDGNTLYYSTTHYSKKGDLDIYVVKRNKDGSWEDPQSVGDMINTPFDDDSPFLAKDGTLFFSSKGHNTMGGYDIFSSTYDSVAMRWSTPVNLGTPINTPDDDTYYRISPDGSYAYLSSYRIGGYGEKDIYTINYFKTVEVKGQLYTKADSTLAPEVELVFRSTRANRQPLEYRVYTSPDSATYTVHVLSGRTYEVEALKDGKQIAAMELEVPMVLKDSAIVMQDLQLPESEIRFNIVAAPDTAAIAQGAQTAGKLTPDTFEIENLLFTTDSYALKPESKEKLNEVARILKLKPEMRISIEGHTDSKASSSYNTTLSRKRTNAAYTYLVKQGVAPEQMSKASYGKSRPLLPNDSLENRRQNRRVEIKVIRVEEGELSRNKEATAPENIN